MQTIKTHWDSVAFGKFLAEVQGFLRSQFGVAANSNGFIIDGLENRCPRHGGGTRRHTQWDIVSLEYCDSVRTDNLE